jgi:hypothetical protein
MDTLVDYYLAGVWTLVWHWGIGVGMIVLLLAATYFSPVGKKEFFAGALLVVLFMAGEYVGVRMESKYRDAKAASIGSSVDKTVQETQTPEAKAAKDRWNNSKY